MMQKWAIPRNVKKKLCIFFARRQLDKFEIEIEIY